jgi:hypothetical protein
VPEPQLENLGPIDAVFPSDTILLPDTEVAYLIQGTDYGTAVGRRGLERADALIIDRFGFEQAQPQRAV